VATVTSTKTAAKPGVGPGWPKPPGNNGSNGNGRGKWFGGRKPFSKDTYRITVWILLAAIVMMFVALASSYIILSGNPEWQPVRMPRAFMFSTGLILISSVTMTAARRQLQRGQRRKHQVWLLVTLLIGLAFLAVQYAGWRQLVSAGAFISSNPHSSFYYLFTGAHGVHLLGGLTALAYLAARSGQVLVGEASEKRSAATDAVALYWHFMDGLWVCLFLLLWLWK
jgi:cytochrome c oxidase subunit III